MKIHVVLNGELKTCCSAYPTTQVQSILSSWFAGDKTVEPVVVDIKKETWQEDERFTAAFKYFGDKAFPIVYIGEKVVAIGNLPSRDQLKAITSGVPFNEITVQDILDAARRQGVKVSH